MLKPREADIPALFLFFVVLPLVTYILLGKWSEVAKKKARVSVLAHIAAEEALRAEAMAAATVIPLVSFPKNVVQECARCFAPATTRCSRCKSIKYCSGKCQIVHWRQVHKQDCLLSQTTSSSSFPNPALIEESLPERLLLNDSRESHFYEYNIKQALLEKDLADYIIDPSISTSAYACSATDTSQVSPLERRSTDKRLSRKAIKGMLTREDGVKFDSFEEVSRPKGTSSTSSMLSKEVYKKHKLRQNDSVVSEEEISKQQDCSSAVNIIANISSISTMHESLKMQNQHENICEPRRNPGYSSSLDTEGGTNGHSIGIKFGGGSVFRRGVTLTVGTEELKRCPEMVFVKESIKAKGTSYPTGTKIPNSSKSGVKAAEEQSCSEVNRMGQIADESKVATMRDCSAAQGSNGVASRGILEKMGLRKSSNFFGDNASEVRDDRDNKFKMLFPYEEFLKYFQCEVFGISPRGLLNCGNSCYANAVLQCLTCTKPLAIYLLRRSHSRACCVKGWCLMCELEKHIRMLRGTGGPMSPSRILSNMRSINCQIGDGSQEDAHEFLRFLVTSMQSICLKGLDGETVVDPRLQETTFIQHTFGGRLRSKVKCLRCRHVSERYENIMDLTLEILGWVESLEDALTQFTTAEDLDGENMYRCGRCAAYVRAKKQLSIHEAPNILTIVLKRFQEGRYGKLNKCITFPDVLDMIPFMSGTDDIPPVYMLYAAVVHLDMLNASFSGHYVSYVKDLQGNWFRVDDTEVQPVLLSQVMSEEAYILFYMRSFPRPPRVLNGKTVRQHAAASSRNCTSKTHKSSRPGQSKQSSHVIGTEPSSNFTSEASVAFLNHTNNGILRSASRDILPTVETYSEPLMEFSDAKSSDWSLFTSSDEASFTTESTRDSFSTVDYADACNINPFSSIFDTLYAPEHSSRNTVSCRAFPNRKLETRFGLEEKGYVSGLSTQPLDRVRIEEDLNQVGDSSIEFPYNTNCDAFVKYRTTEKHSHGRTSSHCIL